jgi:hypothetical protein
VFRENKDIICQKERQCLKPYANKEEMNRCVLYVARVVKKLSNLPTIFMYGSICSIWPLNHPESNQLPIIFQPRCVNIFV